VTCLDEPYIRVVMPGPLGWLALIGAGKVLKQLTIAHRSARAAVRALDARLLEKATPGTWNEPLLRRLKDYAAGRPVDFGDVPIDPGRLTDLQRRVFDQCRQIPYGRTTTYGRLAAAAGSPRAARAVGNCLAANRFALIVPCHRVVAADGRLGGFSAPGGPRTKRRLLLLESQQ